MNDNISSHTIFIQGGGGAVNSDSYMNLANNTAIQESVAK